MAMERLKEKLRQKNDIDNLIVKPYNSVKRLLDKDCSECFSEGT
jgi:hypothetical protein